MKIEMKKGPLAHISPMALWYVFADMEMLLMV
jgi:hypothetical protein